MIGIWTKNKDSDRVSETQIEKDKWDRDRDGYWNRGRDRDMDKYSVHDEI